MLPHDNNDVRPVAIPFPMPLRSYTPPLSRPPSIYAPRISPNHKSKEQIAAAKAQ